MPKTQQRNSDPRPSRETLRTRLAEIVALRETLPKRGKPTADDLLPVLNKTVALALDSIGVVEDEKSAILTELYATRTQLSHRGQAIERADLGDLRSLARNGLIKSEVVESEARRRREAFPQATMMARAMTPDDYVNGSAGGYLPCGHAKCNRLVMAKDGSRCPEHKKTAPREYITSGYQAVNLDYSLADAEKRARDARVLLDDAEEDIKNLRERIADYDKAHPVGA